MGSEMVLIDANSSPSAPMPTLNPGSTLDVHLRGSTVEDHLTAGGSLTIPAYVQGIAPLFCMPSRGTNVSFCAELTRQCRVFVVFDKNATFALIKQFQELEPTLHFISRISAIPAGEGPSVWMIVISKICDGVDGVPSLLYSEQILASPHGHRLLTSAISAAIGEAFLPLSTDPLLEVNYYLMGGLAFAAGIIFWFCFRKLDKEEDSSNVRWAKLHHWLDAAFKGAGKSYLESNFVEGLKKLFEGEIQTA